MPHAPDRARPVRTVARVTAAAAATRRTAGLSRTADGRRGARAPRRAARAAAARRRPGSSAGRPAIGVTLLALFLRLWHLGTPHAFLFDETYYAKDAWSLRHYGYVTGLRRRRQRQDPRRHRHRPVERTPRAMIVHPEVGKWLIALGEKAFGMDPFGWRVAVGRRRLADGAGDGAGWPAG